MVINFVLESNSNQVATPADICDYNYDMFYILFAGREEIAETGREEIAATLYVLPTQLLKQVKS